MSTTPHRDADHETLSALFDGELQGGAARFAVKRLDHDAQWRDACGRWQLLGDALRGQATGVAPMGFADRVGAALAEEAVAAPTIATTGAATGTIPAAMPMRRRWIGGAALAASVAVAALFVARPFSQSNLPPVPTPPVAANAQPAAPATGDSGLIARQSSDDLPAPVPPSPPPQSSTRAAPEVALAATAVAVAEVPRRVASERGSREAGQPAAPASSQGRIDSSSTIAVAPTAIASNADAAPTGLEPSSTHPFLPQDEIISRPWPRAVLPNYPVGSAFTASFDSNASAGASSFYPFEPRMLDTDRSLDADRSQDSGPVSSDWPRR